MKTMEVVSEDRTRSWLHDSDYKVVPLGEKSALFLTGNHRIFLTPADLGERLTRGLGEFTDDEAREWSALERLGLLTDVHRDRLARSSYSDGSNLALNINLTGACNLACSYCFADGGDYGRIYKKMDIHTVDYIFNFIAQHVTPSRKVRFEFFGGEPLLNFPIIREICERSDKMAEETGISFLNRISTNLTILPEGAVELFRDRKFIVSVSIDGGAETHNTNRPSKSGKESFSGILQNCMKVREAGSDITLVARMTVVSGGPTLIKDVLELHGLNIFDYFQIYPAVTAPGSSTCGGKPELVQLALPAAEGQPKPATMSFQFLDQLSKLVTLYPQMFGKDQRFKGILEYERIAEMLIDGKMALAFCGGGGTYFTFSPDDSVMPCHRLVGESEFQVGSGADGLNEALTEEWLLPVDSHPVCSGCWARYVCGGNCRQENFLATGTLRGLNEDTCRYQQHLLAQIIQHLGNASAEYLAASRSLDDMFVSCGRPITNNLREGEEELAASFQHFQLLLPPRKQLA